MTTIHLSLSKMNLRRPSTTPGMPVPSAYGGRTISVGVPQSLSYWDSIHYDIESYLKKNISIREPVSVFEPMHHLTFTPPQTTASALCVAACELVGGNREDAIVAASAIHLLHAAIYTHDQLLLTDRVEPEPKIPHRFGPEIELLTGTGIFSLGLELLAGSIDPASNNSDIVLRVIMEITRATGAQGMVNGQDCEDEFDQLNGQPLRLLHGCGAACGAILGGGSEEEIERLKKYGVYAGKIEGLLIEIDRSEGGKRQLAEKWRDLALKELEYFDDRKIEQISTIVKI